MWTETGRTGAQTSSYKLFLSLFIFNEPLSVTLNNSKEYLKAGLETNNNNNKNPPLIAGILHKMTFSCLVTVSRLAMSNSLWPHGLQPDRLFCPWDFPGNNTRVCCHFLLQGSSQPRDWTQISHVTGRFFTFWATRGALAAEGNIQTLNCFS